MFRTLPAASTSSGAWGDWQPFLDAAEVVEFWICASRTVLGRGLGGIVCRMRRHFGSLGRGAIAGALASFPASWAKQLSEPPLQRWSEQLFVPKPGEKEMVGADPSGRPENMPPAVLAERASRTLTGKGLSTQQKVLALHAIHYGFGAVLGAAYAAYVTAVPRAGIGWGAPAGLIMYGLTHGSAVPAMGLQRPPWRLPRAAMCWELTSHLVFGVVLEVSRRAIVTTVAWRDD